MSPRPSRVHHQQPLTHTTWPAQLRLNKAHTSHHSVHSTAGKEPPTELSDDEDKPEPKARTFKDRFEPPRAGEPVKLEECKTKFHGKSMFDYQGRSFIEPPKGLRASDGDHDCFIPKRCVHKYDGHNGAVNVRGLCVVTCKQGLAWIGQCARASHTTHTQLPQSIEFFPKWGHLILSGSSDKKVKIWDVYAKRHCKRTYFGHGAAIRDVKFKYGCGCAEWLWL